MASREPTYPAHHKALLVQAYNEDDAKFSRKIRTIKAVITELEDENNLVAYKIAKTRRRIEEKKALLEAQQAPIVEHRSFWGGRKSVAADEVKPVESPKAPEKKSRAKGGKKAQKDLGPPTTIAPLHTDELSYMGDGRPPTDYTPDPGYTSSIPAAPQDRHDEMDVDELDDDY